MLKTLCNICNVLLVITLILGIFVVTYIINQSWNNVLPALYIETVHILLDPFIHTIQHYFGYQVYTYNGHPMEEAYSLLLFYIIALFIFFLALSQALQSADTNLHLWVRRLTHRFFMWRQKKTVQHTVVTSLGNPYQPDTGAILALSLENLDRYPTLQKALQPFFERLNNDQLFYDEDGYILLKFTSTIKAFNFSKVFTQAFKQHCQLQRIVFEFKPIYRMALHSFSANYGFFEDQHFISALLKCVAHNQIYISSQAKEQLDIQAKAFNPDSFEMTLIGTFSQLGNRTLPDVYRLQFIEKDDPSFN